MEKEKPRVFVNHINKKVNNSQATYYSKVYNMEENKKSDKEKLVEKSPVSNKKVSYSKLDKFKEKNPADKLDILMSLPEYLVNIDLEIVTKDETLEVNIAGKTDSDLITVDSKLIPIKDIIDIKIKE